MFPKKLKRMVDRAVELVPELVQEPRRIVGVAKGLHPGSLVSLDVPWVWAFDPDVVLDIGANTGQFGQVALHVFPRARVLSFEPLPECVQAMGKRIGANPRFRIFPYAIGNADTTITIHRSASSPSSSILPMNEAHTSAFPWTEGREPVEVPLRRLDSLLPDLGLTGRVLMKIDVQGFGLEVLKGAVATLQRVDMVFIEVSFVSLYEGEPSFHDIYAFMRDAGFAYSGLLDSLEHPETKEALQGDAIFRRTA
jgi:FkbM family methyltransferase